ncbi:MAG: hypothetical protein MUE98_11350 [Rhodobacteraceae bacterium]|nr:hypothetical protein [Paracoccaceae bacterium]
MRALAFVARNGRHALVAGLVAGVLLPGVASALAGWIAPLVAVSLFLAVLRIGPEGLRASRRDAGRLAARAVLLQSALPLAALGLLTALDLAGHPLGLGLVVMLAAAPVTASPHLAVMIGADPGPALRQVVAGTALLPLTVLPVFAMLPGFGDAGGVGRAVGGLLLLIAGAGGAALALRATRVVQPTPATLTAIDALAALTLGLVVVGIMAAVGPALRADPAPVAAALAVAFAANAALQVGGAALARRLGAGPAAPALGLVAGNRNLALFLGVLPVDVAGALMLFIGCYQIPMYLTPVLMRRILNLRTG